MPDVWERLWMLNQTDDNVAETFYINVRCQLQLAKCKPSETRNLGTLYIFD